MQHQHFIIKMRNHIQNRIQRSSLKGGDSPYYRIGAELSLLHQGSAGFPYTNIGYPEEIVYLDKWHHLWSQGLKKLENYRDSLFQGGIGTPFEELFLQNYTYFSQLGQIALYYLEDHDYQKLIKELTSYGILAYRDFSWNDIKEVNGRYTFIRPEQWVIDLSIRDVGQFVKRVSMLSLSLSEAAQFLSGYQAGRPFLACEYPLLYAILLYPEKVIHLAEHYFEYPVNKNRELEEELRTLITTYQKWESVLATFPEHVHRQFGVKITPVEWLQSGLAKREVYEAYS